METRTSLSPAVERALDLLFDGQPTAPPPALSEDERTELAGLVATAILTRGTLQAPVPDPRVEDASLRRAQKEVRAWPPGTAAPPSGGASAAGENWLARWWRRRRLLQQRQGRPSGPAER